MPLSYRSSATTWAHFDRLTAKIGCQARTEGIARRLQWGKVEFYTPNVHLASACSDKSFVFNKSVANGFSHGDCGEKLRLSRLFCAVYGFDCDLLQESLNYAKVINI